MNEAAPTPAARRDALWFGPDHPCCFGVLHRPTGSTTRAIVLCNALGFEGQTAHRSLRHLADRLAAAGFLVLRFDYDGVGDSDGAGEESARVGAWLTSIQAAIAHLRSAEGATEVSLVGIRSGALLAGLVADEVPGIRALALWAPTTSGRALARELKLLSRMAKESRPPDRDLADGFPSSVIEVAGFWFSEDTLAELAALDLAAAAPAVADAIVLDPRDQPASGALLAGLAAAGAEVEHHLIDDFAPFMVDDETLSVLPMDSIDLLASYFAGLAPEGADALAEASVSSDQLEVRDPGAAGVLPPTGALAPVCETATWIDGDLFAITTVPAGGPTRAAAIVLPNTGSVNRTGPGRLYVTLARYWASLGFVVIRTDLGGTGDSPRPVDRENRPYDRERTDELLRVVAWARGHAGVSAVSLFGACSGAYHSFHAALADPEIASIILGNPIVFHVSDPDDVEGSADRAVMSAATAWRALGSRRAWKQAVHTERNLPEALSRAIRGTGYLVAAKVRDLVGRKRRSIGHRPPLQQDLARLADHGTLPLFVFTVDEPGMRTLRSFGGDLLRSLEADGRVRVVELEDGDHVFSPRGARRQLIEETTGHLTFVHPLRRSVDQDLAPTGVGP